MQLATIQPIAQTLTDQLASACVRLEIAGSVRRGKADPHDLELVGLPVTGEYTIPNLFGEVVERHGMFFSDGLLHGHAPIFDEQGDAKPCPNGETCRKIIETPEERDVFDALEIPWIEPHKRTANLLYAVRPGSYRPGGR